MKIVYFQKNKKKIIIFDGDGRGGGYGELRYKRLRPYMVLHGTACYMVIHVTCYYMLHGTKLYMVINVKWYYMLYGATSLG